MWTILQDSLRVLLGVIGGKKRVAFKWILARKQTKTQISKDIFQMNAFCWLV
jgi:hypothetical protein